jgi:hypothetical protein
LSLLRALALTLTSLSLCLVPAAAAHAQGIGGTAAGGVAAPTPTPVPTPAANITVPGTVAKLLPDGTAAAPAAAPLAVQQAIWAANQLQSDPYIYGGGHASFQDDGYDCSGTVSYALHGAGLISTPMDSSDMMHWGASGAGQWITVYSNPGHAYMVIAGLRLDTSTEGVSSRTIKLTGANKHALDKGPRWRPTKYVSKAFTVRHPVGF